MSPIIDAHLHVWDEAAAGLDPGPMRVGYSAQATASVELFMDYPQRRKGRHRAMSIDRYNVGPRLSQAVRHADTIYVAGTVADDPSAGVKGQTEQILRKIDATLAHFGSNKSKLLSATIWLSNMASYDDMNAAWDAWVDRANTPARATVESRLARPGFLVEIAAIAAV